MRLFTGINFTDEIKNDLMSIIETMRSQVNANYTLRNNLHMTLVFIGETNKNNEIISNLNKIKFEPFKIEFSGHGKFRDICWVGVKPNHTLTKLQNGISEVLQIKPDYNFTPHITLAREVSAEFEFDVPEMKMDVNTFDLMKSERINGVLKYSVIATFHRS
ncbi:MAG: RNA 2',3'-cyclic phosphodiesterase [Oscillospiraceae bacterium]|nr:RNA 2',3'-cyclic phosphodiesterase [Oscillospiraceae bacterium]